MLSVLIPVVASAAMAASPGAGDTAPPISIEHALQTPEGVTLDWEAFGDAPVLLEFWGTWCGPCVAAIPHLNDLAEELRDDGLRVLAVTFEEPEVVEKFLKLRSVEGWVLCDTDRSMVKDFGVVSWPQTFLIQDGKILLRTHPSGLDAKSVRDVFAGRVDVKTHTGASQQGMVTAGVDPFGEDELAEPVFSLIIREGAGEGGSSAVSPDRVTMVSISALQIVSWAWGVDYKFVDVDAAAAKQTYDVVAVMPPGTFDVYQFAIKSIITETLGIHVAFEDREITGYELSVVEGGITMPLAPSDSGGMSMSTNADGSINIASVSMSIELLASMMPGLLGAPVRNTIESDERYFVDLSFPGREPAQVIEAFREQAGIEVVPYETTATFAVVTLAGAPEHD